MAYTRPAMPDLEKGQLSASLDLPNMSRSARSSMNNDYLRPSSEMMMSSQASSDGMSVNEKDSGDQLSFTYQRPALLSSIQDVHVPLEPDGYRGQEISEKKGPQWYRNIRWLLFSTYRRLFSFAFIANLGVLIGLSASHKLTFSSAGTAAAVNLVMSILMRQEHVINTLFLLASSVPFWVPLVIRRRVAKVYCYGGLHSGCGVAAACWYIAFTGYLTSKATTEHTYYPPAAMAYVVVVLLFLIVGFAYPTIRSRMHDQFEVIHRFSGWVVVAIYWAQTLVLTNAEHKLSSPPQSFGSALVNTPAFWCIIIITFCLFYPWIRLRKRSVYVEKLSDHAARLHFDYTQLNRCLGVRLSTNPLFESHAFATIPAARPNKGFSCLVSNAGDWTRSIISEPGARGKIWMKGAPTYGVLRTAMIFKRTVVVGTGSGIGPCLSLINDNDNIHCRVLWSAAIPKKTYGDDIIDAIYRVDPHAIVWDTRKQGRPDMVAMTYRLYKESGAEAVFVVSNPKVTRSLIYGLESRGVPAFAPIFDS